MTRLLRLVLPFAVFLGYLLWALVSFAATPRASVTVSGDEVTLGDIFDGAGTAAGRVVMAAPAAGRSIVLDNVTLSRLATGNGISWQSLSGNEFARITRASQSFDAAAIGEGVISSLALPTPATGQTSVQLDNPQLSLHAPVGTPVELAFGSLALDATGQRFSGIAQLKSGERIITQAAIAGRVVTTIDVPVLSRPMRRNEVIGANDVTWQSMELTSATSNVLFSAEDLIGKMPRTGMRPNTPVRMADLITPAAISRGAQVTMIYQTGSLTITTQGRALSEAAIGQTIRVVNTASSRTVEGVVEAAGLVRIGPAPITQTTAELAAAPGSITAN